MTLVDFLVQHGAPVDWRQAGADFATAVLDGKHDIAEAVRSIVPTKVTLPQHAANGQIEVVRYVEVGGREIAEFHVGISYAIGWRDAVRTGATAAGRAVPPRTIGFRPH